MSLKNWGRIAGLFGVVVLFSAVFNWLFVTGSIASAAVIARFTVGAAGIAFWLVTNRGDRPLGRGAFYGAVSAVSALVLVAALAGINYIVVKKAKSWDLTKDRIFTLSDQTIGVLKGLKEPVTVQAFFSGSEPEYVELDSRLRQYKAQTDKLSVEFVDPFKHPGRVKDLNISQSGPRVIVKSGNKESRAKEISEEALTNALIEVSRGSTKKIYFTKGHGEHAVADNTERGLKLFVDNLKGDGYQTDEIILAEHKEMPPEAQNPEIAIAQSYAEHPITQPRSSPFALATIFPIARSVSKSPTAPSGWTATELAKTGERAWGETGSLSSGQVKFDPGQDLKGPVSLAASSTKGTESRVVVIGNSLFAANGYYRLSGNRDFALNAVSWVAKEESRISIRPKQRQGNHLFLSAEQKRTMTLFAFDLLPFGMLFAGLVVWQTRKSR